MGLVVEWQELLRLRQSWSAQGKVVVWTNGCFDLLRLGHIKSLQRSKEQGDILVVELNSDNSVRRLKGEGRPLFPKYYRAEMLAAVVYVDYVVIFEDIEPSRLVEELKPEVICKGADYADGKKPMPEAEMVRSYGGRVCFIALFEDYSTKRILQSIQQLAQP